MFYSLIMGNLTSLGLRSVRVLLLPIEFIFDQLQMTKNLCRRKILNSTSVFKVLEPSVPQLGGQNEFEFGRAGNFDQLSCSSRFFFMRSFLEANDFKNCESVRKPNSK